MFQVQKTKDRALPGTILNIGIGDAGKFYEQNQTTPAQEEVADFAPPYNLRWVPFALLAGLGTIGLYEGLRRIVTGSASRIGETATQGYSGPLLTLGGGFLLFVSVYYLYRMLARED